MLTSAIILMHQGNITVYHFNIVSDLAWFSSNTHLLSLLVIRTFLGGDKDHYLQPNQNKRIFVKDGLRCLRVLLMTIMAGLLLFVSYITGVEVLYDNLNCPMNCLIPLKKGGSALQWSIANIVLILCSYPSCILCNINTFSRAWLRMRHEILQLHKAILVRLGGHRRGWVLANIYRYSAFLAEWTWTLLASELWTVIELSGWLGLGVFSVIEDRAMGQACQYADGQSCMSPDQWANQDLFTFGQLVPMFLLGLPILAFIEAFDDD